MKNQVVIFFLVMIAILLSACSTSLSPQMAEMTSKNRKLDSPRFLTQTRYLSWINTISDVITIDRSGDSRGCLPGDSCLPTISDYQKNPSIWHDWTNKRNSQYRIVGLLPAGTEFHFYKIQRPDNPDDGYFVFYAMIDSGQFQGVHAYYKYDRKNPSDLNLLHEASVIF
jgi:hypothetical protein